MEITRQDLQAIIKGSHDCPLGMHDLKHGSSVPAIYNGKKEQHDI